MGIQDVSFWPRKRVVITGGAGFLGSHLVEKLVQNAADVVVADDHSRGYSRRSGADFHVIDVGDVLSCRRIFEGADVVFNLAACVAGVLFNQSHHLEMFERNLRLQTAPVLAAKSVGVPRFLQVSSVCVYAPQYAASALEENGQAGEPVEANSGYAWAKRMGERVALWAGLPHLVIVRPSNLFGPRDHFDERAHVIPALIRKCLEQDVIQVHGTGHEIREFLYVEDAAEGMIAALEQGKPGAVYNMGTHGVNRMCIADLVAEIQRLTGAESKPVYFTGGDAGDSDRWSNCGRMTEEVGWSYRTSLLEGLQRTVEWYMREQLVVV